MFIYLSTTYFLQHKKSKEITLHQQNHAICVSQEYTNQTIFKLMQLQENFTDSKQRTVIFRQSEF